jgi:hypothetical protein
MKRRNTLVSNRTRAAKLRRARQKKFYTTDHGKYQRAKNNALQRGVEWLFDESSWLKVWKDSGRWKDRGQAPGKFQMARLGDCGPYADWNVRIVRMESNAIAALLDTSRYINNNRSEFRDEVASIL